MSVWETICAKHAIRDFNGEPISDEHIHRILDAGRRAMSGYNTQPWQFIAATDAEKLQTLAKIGRSTGHAAEAALVVALLTPHPNEKYWRDQFDAGQTAAYMMLTAQELGIGSCPGSVGDVDLARSILHFPDEWDLKVIISFGYPDPNKYPDRPPKIGGRKAFGEVVHWETW